MREGQVIQSILQSAFILRAPLDSSEETHRLLQPLHRVVVVLLLVGHLWATTPGLHSINSGSLDKNLSLDCRSKHQPDVARLQELVGFWGILDLG